MKNLFCYIMLGLVLLQAGAAALPGPAGWSFEELRRFKAEEARQGVVADGEFLYVVSNHTLGKYRKATGERLARWECPRGQPLTHLNAGVIHDGRLYCAHSNFPGVPHLSSVEIWDPHTLQHVDSISFGRTDGSLTWFDRRGDRWVVCFVHYGRPGGEPGKGSEWTRLVEFDNDWRPTGRGWAFPQALLDRLGTRGFSVSGGAMGPDDLLFVTGHDETELYLLSFPKAAATLQWVATVPMTAEGQSFAWDPVEPGVIHLIIKNERLVITGRVTRKDVVAE
ncbi:MAG: hypothetical protein KIT44_09990 [Opitutaceae bacterium]|nr:hypothetical protein [Opitutaceae bacterium]